jgi:hypothetical protein
MAVDGGPEKGGRMVAIEGLGIYLNDHLGGAAAGVELAERLRSSNEGTPFGSVLAGLVLEIKEDRATLENLMDRLGVQRSAGKQTGGRGLERLSRLRTSKTFTRNAELSRLLGIEALQLGVEGKFAMWRALGEIAELDQRLAATDFAGLGERARRQRDTLEQYRLRAAVLAFSPDS